MEAVPLNLTVQIDLDVGGLDRRFGGYEMVFHLASTRTRSSNPQTTHVAFRIIAGRPKRLRTNPTQTKPQTGKLKRMPLANLSVRPQNHLSSSTCWPPLAD